MKKYICIPSVEKNLIMCGDEFTVGLFPIYVIQYFLIENIK